MSGLQILLEVEEAYYNGVTILIGLSCYYPLPNTFIILIILSEILFDPCNNVTCVPFHPISSIIDIM